MVEVAAAFLAGSNRHVLSHRCRVHLPHLLLVGKQSVFDSESTRTCALRGSRDADAVGSSRWLSLRSTPCTPSLRSRAGAASPWLPAIWASPPPHSVSPSSSSKRASA